MTRPTAPLAQQLRPLDLSQFFGQEALLGKEAALRGAIEEDRVTSSIFFGPPGVGKTTLARLIAHHSHAEFVEASAVSVGVAEVRKVIAEARERVKEENRRTILFLDEIHRFNKAQQDALLPAVEEGSITLVGATTENPYISLNNALLSRCSLYEFHPLSKDDLIAIVRRGAETLTRNLDEEVIALIARRGGGDARSALSILEGANELASSKGKSITTEQIEEVVAQKRPLGYDRDGDLHYDFASALIKSMRGSDVDAALYYLAVMIQGGEDPRFIARRMVIFASEDIGNADPRALQVAVTAAQAVGLVGLPECSLNLAQAACYLALAPKSGASSSAIWAAMGDVAEHGALRPPDIIRSSSYRGESGAGKGYVSPHREPGKRIQYLPDTIKNRRYYHPSGNGEESTFGREAAGRMDTERTDESPPG